MPTIAKIIGTIVLILAVMGYTVFNYISGKTDMTLFLVSMGLLSYVLIGMINQLIQYLKKK